MIEQQAVVVAVDASQCWVETQRPSACGQCATQSGCGVAVLGAFQGQRRTRMQVVSTVPLQVGDTVLLGLAEGVLLRGALVLYGLPIGLLLVGAVLGQLAFARAGEALVIAAAAAGLGLGLLMARVLTGRGQGGVLTPPVVLRRLDAAPPLPSARA